MLALIVIGAVMAAVSAQDSCPVGFHTFGPYCYLISTYSLTWDQAKTDCESRGAFLAEILHEEQDRYIKKLTEDELSAGINVWIGAKRSTTNPQNFVYAKSMEEVGSTNFYDWYPSEPNNSGGNEDCVQIRPGLIGKWNDKSCDTLNNFICQTIKSSYCS